MPNGSSTISLLVVWGTPARSRSAMGSTAAGSESPRSRQPGRPSMPGTYEVPMRGSVATVVTDPPSDPERARASPIAPSATSRACSATSLACSASFFARSRNPMDER